MKIGNMNRVTLLMLTWNRLEYTKMSLEYLFKNTIYPYDLWIIDNKNTKDDTRKYLIDLKKREPKITRLILNDTNEGLSKPTNQFWRETNTEMVGKVDNDTLVPKGWLTKLVEALDKVPQLMMVSGIHFKNWKLVYGNFYVPCKTINGVRLYFPTHTGGCCYILRRTTINKAGYLEERVGRLYGWTRWQWHLKREGMMLAYHNDVRVELLGGEYNEICSLKSLDNTPKYQEYNKEIHIMRTTGR